MTNGTNSLQGTSSLTVGTTPVNNSTNGYLLYNNNGVLGDQAPGGVGSLTVGTTVILSGTSGRVVYDNAGVIGEYTITGSAGSVVMSNGPTLVTPILGVATATSLTIGTQQVTQGSLILANTAAGAFSTTVKSSNTASAAWTLTLPTTAGTNLYVLQTDGFGTTSWVPQAGTTLTVGTTIIASGTTGRVLYDNGAVLGEYTITGTAGSVVMSNGPTLVTPILGVATATSLAIGGATIGTDALGVTGTSTFSGAVTLGAQQTVQGSLVLANTAAGAFATTVKSSNSASAAWTLTLPVTAGTNTYLLQTNGSGVTSWIPQSSVGLTVGTTAIASGTTGRVLYDNGGILGEYTITGTAGSVVMSNTPTLVTPVLGAATATSIAIGAGSAITSSGPGGAMGAGAFASNVSDIAFVIDGGGSAITTGTKGYLEIPFGCVITRATLLADQSGSAVVNIWMCTYAQFDAGSTHPISTDKITSSTPPTITTATKSQDSTLSGWTTTIPSGNILAFNVDSATTVQRLTLSLQITRS